MADQLFLVAEANSKSRQGVIMGSRVTYDWGVLVLHHGYLLSKVLEAVKRERDARMCLW